jgi:hypothetical protein
LNKNLHDFEDVFQNHINIFFPNFCDIKYLINEFDALKHDGLNKLASDLKVFD